MAVYLLNFGFSMTSTSATDGNFEPYDPQGVGLAQSCAWFTYVGTPTLSLQDNPYLLSTDMDASQWQAMGDDTTTLPLELGDFILVRVCPGDSSAVTGSTMRLTVVFGEGQGRAHDHSNRRQSPLQIVQGSATTARPVVDTSSNTGFMASPTGDNSWTYCLGAVHGATAHYSMNVGATVAPPTGAVGVYGHDPTVHVKGGGPEPEYEAA